MAYVCAFANQKGGVGKTTSCVSIASCAASRGLRVLLIDSDPQGNSTSGVGISKKKIKKSVYDILTDGCAPSDCIVHTDFMDCVPSTLNLAGAEFELYDEERRESRLKDFIAQCADDYDFIAIDCPPSLSMLTINALTAANGVVIPMQCEYYALEGLSQLMTTISKVKKAYNQNLNILGILITMYNGRLNLSVQVLDEIKKYYADKLLKTVIPRSVKLSEAPGFGEPINYYDKFGKAAQAYAAVTDELLTRAGL